MGMTTMIFSRARLASLLAFTLITGSALAAAPPDHWVGTWATADVDRANTKGDFGATDTTLRQIVHVSLGGPMVRLELSNAFGTEPLTVGAVHLAVAGAKGEIALPTANVILFGGKPTIVIPPGASVVSDGVALKVEPLSDLAISIFLPAQKISHITQHGSAYQTNYMVAGNVVGEKALPEEAKTFANWFFLKAVDVKTAADTGRGGGVWRQHHGRDVQLAGPEQTLAGLSGAAAA